MYLANYLIYCTKSSLFLLYRKIRPLPSLMQSYNILKQLKPGRIEKLSDTSSLILHHGWAALTVRHYAAAVNRYFLFANKTGTASFPATTNSIYKFICWCNDNKDNNTVLSNTTKRYLTGLRMWHVLHDTPFPIVNNHRVRLLLKASQKIELNRPSTRIGFTLIDVHRMVKDLNTQELQHIFLRGVILTGLWGLERLGELTLSTTTQASSYGAKTSPSTQT